jgi:biopolymer transport protein ExbD
MSFEVNDNADDVMSEINMTPLVDVMLVLLIIFIITIPVVQHAVKVELPRTSSTRDKTPPENLQLAVDAQGQFFLGKTAIAADALEAALQVEAAKDDAERLASWSRTLPAADNRDRHDILQRIVAYLPGAVRQARQRFGAEGF